MDLTNKRGFAEGPFQMLITVIVMGMAIIVGFTLINHVNQWRCEEQMNIQATKFSEKLANVAAGGTGTVENFKLEIPRCVKAMYIKHIGGSKGKKDSCKYQCPKHPNRCWLLVVDIENRGISMSCIDVPGSLEIGETSGAELGTLRGCTDNDWCKDDGDIKTHTFIAKTYLMKISKPRPGRIEIGKP
jgi:hypothetical protein